MVRRQAKLLNLAVDEQRVQKLLALRDLILRYNKRTNLVAKCSAEEAVERHLIDSLALTRILDRRKDLAPNADERRIIDIGSGGGFPGLVLALAYPEVEVHLVEPIAKKLALVQQAASSVGLRNVVAHNTRVEHLNRPSMGCWAVSRATFHPPEWVKRAADFMPAGGAFIAMLGGADFPELESSATWVDRFHLPVSGALRRNAVFVVPDAPVTRGDAP